MRIPKQIYLPEQVKARLLQAKERYRLSENEIVVRALKYLFDRRASNREGNVLGR